MSIQPWAQVVSLDVLLFHSLHSQIGIYKTQVVPRDSIHAQHFQFLQLAEAVGKSTQAVASKMQVFEAFQATNVTGELCEQQVLEVEPAQFGQLHDNWRHLMHGVGTDVQSVQSVVDISEVWRQICEQVVSKPENHTHTDKSNIKFLLNDKSIS